MPSVTLNTTTENAQRIVSALERLMEREEGETDLDLFKRHLKEHLRHVVFQHEKLLAAVDVVPDDGIVT